MIKKLTAGVAAAALAAGLAVAGATTAHAIDLTPHGITLCAPDESGTVTVTCTIEVADASVTEGTTTDVVVNGVAGAEIAIGLFANGPEGLVKVGDDVPVTVGEDGSVTVQFPVPTMTGSLEGGSGFWIAVADTPADPVSVHGDTVTVLSARPSLAYDAYGNGTTDSPFVLNLAGGLSGDEIKVQALVDGEWVDFTTVSGGTIDADGKTELHVVSPEVAEGTYPVRFFNTTKGVAGAEDQYTLYFGVTPEEDPTPTPSPSPSPDPTDEPTEEPTEGPTEEPTASPTATPTSGPTSGPSQPDGKARPGMPRTGA